MNHHYHSDYEFQSASPENRRCLRQEELIIDITEVLAEVMQQEGISKEKRGLPSDWRNQKSISSKS